MFLSFNINWFVWHSSGGISHFCLLNENFKIEFKTPIRIVFRVHSKLDWFYFVCSPFGINEFYQNWSHWNICLEKMLHSKFYVWELILRTKTKQLFRNAFNIIMDRLEYKWLQVLELQMFGYIYIHSSCVKAIFMATTEHCFNEPTPI